MERRNNNSDDEGGTSAATSLISKTERTAATETPASAAPETRNSLSGIFSNAAAEAEAEKKLLNPVNLIGGLCCLLTLLGIVDILGNVESNGCRMTYMYQYPQYREISSSSASSHPKYNLYLYDEGDRNSDFSQLNGIPVLFIPGNSGSYKQVRSLASVALRKSLDKEDGDYHSSIHFDYFSLDFGEELSAIYGGFLKDQTLFVQKSIDTILSLYNNRNNGPKSVVLVGHSIGGLIAKALFAKSDFDPKLVHTIVNLATPISPVILTDYQLHSFYRGVDSFWDKKRPEHVLYASIGGGFRDVQVRGGLTYDKHADINALTSSIPGIWVSTDHLCIAWCNQFVLALNRALFQSVNKKNKKMSLDKELRRKIFEYHLEKNRISTYKNYKPDSLKPALNPQFDKEGYWNDIIQRQFTFSKTNVSCSTYLMVRVLDDPKSRTLNVEALNLPNTRWIFGCSSTEIIKSVRQCTEGIDLSDSTIVLPGPKRKTIHIDMEKAKEMKLTHIVVHIPKDSSNVKVLLDSYSPFHRHKEVDLPRWITFWKSYPVIDKTVPGAVFYNLSLKEFDLPWNAYSFSVQPLVCDNDNNKDHFGLVRFIDPWYNETNSVIIGHNMKNKITAKMQHAKTNGSGGLAQIHLHLNPACNYKIMVRAQLNEIWGQMIRYYFHLMFPYMTSALLLVLSKQYRAMSVVKEGEEQKFISSIEILAYGQVTPVMVIPWGRLLNMLFGSWFFFTLTTDFGILAEQGIDFGILPIIIFFSCIGLLFLITLAAWFCIIFFGNIAHTFMTKFIAQQQRIIPPELIVEGVETVVTKFPSALSAILIALAVSTCGSVSILLGTFFNFVQIFKMFASYLEAKARNDNSGEMGPIYFKFSFAFLWLMAAILNIPTLLAWTNNLSTNTPLPNDPSILTAIILSICLMFSWNEKLPKKNIMGYDLVANFLHFGALIVVLFTSIAIYRLNYIITSIYALMTFHQKFAPSKPPLVISAEAAAVGGELEEEESNEVNDGESEEEGEDGGQDGEIDE